MQASAVHQEEETPADGRSALLARMLHGMRSSSCWRDVRLDGDVIHAAYASDGSQWAWTANRGYELVLPAPRETLVKP